MWIPYLGLKEWREVAAALIVMAEVEEGSSEGEETAGWLASEGARAALDSAGLRRVRFHDLRHAFGTAAISKLDPFKVQSYMGHQHYSTTQRYLHHKPRREDAAVLLLAAVHRQPGAVIGLVIVAGLAAEWLRERLRRWYPLAGRQARP